MDVVPNMEPCDKPDMSRVLAAAVDEMFDRFHEQLVADVHILLQNTSATLDTVRQLMLSSHQNQLILSRRQSVSLTNLPDNSVLGNNLDSEFGDNLLRVRSDAPFLYVGAVAYAEPDLNEFAADHLHQCRYTLAKADSSASLLVQSQKCAAGKVFDADKNRVVDGDDVEDNDDDNSSEWSVQTCPPEVGSLSKISDGTLENLEAGGLPAESPRRRPQYLRYKSTTRRRESDTAHRHKIKDDDDNDAMNVADAAIDGLADEQPAGLPVEQIVCLRDDRRARRLQKRLRVMLMDPVQKVKLHHKKTLIRPIVQTMKILLVTLQIILFAQLRFPEQTYLTQLRFTLSSRMLGDLFDAGSDPYFSFLRLRDGYQYGAEGIVATSQYNDLLSTSLDTFCNMPTDSVWTLDRVSRNATICTKYFEDISFNNSRNIYSVNRTIFHACEKFNPCTDSFDAFADIPYPNFTLLIGLSLHFEFYAFKYNRLSLVTMDQHELVSSARKTESDENVAKCSSSTQFSEPLLVNVTIQLDHSNHAPRIPVKMRFRFGDPAPVANLQTSRSDSHSDLHACSVKDMFASRDIPMPGSLQFWLFIVNSVVCVLAVVSLVLCFRSLVRSQILRLQVQRFFHKNFPDYKMSHDEWWMFVNMWLIFHVATDILLICATVTSIEWYSFPLKLFMFNRLNADVYVILFSSAALLCWVNMLRYFTHFAAYNILLRTVKGSMPNVLRYSVCWVIIYMSLVMFAWLVFGPYYPKFRTFMSTFEALFSLILNDDVNNSLVAIGKANGTMIWFTLHVFVYAFILSFSYIIIGLCATIIIDTYDEFRNLEREKEVAQQQTKTKKANVETISTVFNTLNDETATNAMSSTPTGTESAVSAGDKNEQQRQMWPPQNILQWFINARDDDVLIINRYVPEPADTERHQSNRPHISAMPPGAADDDDARRNSPDANADGFEFVQVDADAEAIDTAIIQAAHGLTNMASRARMQIVSFVNRHRFWRRNSDADAETQHLYDDSSPVLRRPPTVISIVADEAAG